MASDNDFSAITQLMDIKRLYEEQEEKWKLRLTEKEEISKYGTELREQRRATQGRDEMIAELEGEINRLRTENDRIGKEGQMKISQLNERIKELNQRVVLAEGGARPAAAQGFFKK